MRYRHWYRRLAESATEHSRVSEGTTERRQRRKRDDESCTDVIVRLLDEDRDLRAGFGAADRAGETLSETVARRKERSTTRSEQLADGRADQA